MHLEEVNKLWGTETLQGTIRNHFQPFLPQPFSGQAPSWAIAHLYPQPWAAGTVALLRQWATWRLQQEGRTHGAGDGQCWNDEGVPWLRNPQESQALTGKSCGSPILLPSGLLRDRCAQQSSTVGSFLSASHSQPFKAEAGRAPPSSWLPGKPTPDTVLALKGCLLLSTP